VMYLTTSTHTSNEIWTLVQVEIKSYHAKINTTKSQ